MRKTFGKVSFVLSVIASLWLILGMLKMSEICILMSIFIAFVTTGYLWFSGQQQEALFTATWIPSILTFVIYTEIISRKD